MIRERLPQELWAGFDSKFSTSGRLPADSDRLRELRKWHEKAKQQLHKCHFDTGGCPIPCVDLRARRSLPPTLCAGQVRVRWLGEDGSVGRPPPYEFAKPEALLEDDLIFHKATAEDRR